MDDFIVYPAIDLRQGRVVRLSQGDPERETSYNNQPLQVAKRWLKAGATWLHVVNLDGAFGEKGIRNIQALTQITALPLNVQFGGGLRDLESIRRALALGIQRVVLGTVAVHNPEVVVEALEEFGPEYLSLGIDARDGLINVRGWRETTQLKAVDLASHWADIGGKWLVFTDISRDGMGSGVNVEATAALAKQTGLHVIASGGVGSLLDVTRVRAAELSGVIIGRALYEGQVDLTQVIALSTL
jgi:phosphoribosylformimino-5-aminoimidazole carboxamide ribotide isomerase